MASNVAFRLKVKCKDGRELPYTRYQDGAKMSAIRVTIATVFRNSDGKLGVKFDPEYQKAIKKVLGLSDSDVLYFDLYEEARPNGGDGGSEDLDF